MYIFLSTIDKWNEMRSSMCNVLHYKENRQFLVRSFDATRFSLLM